MNLKLTLLVLFFIFFTIESKVFTYTKYSLSECEKPIFKTETPVGVCLPNKSIYSCGESQLELKSDCNEKCEECKTTMDCKLFKFLTL
jgi:hypothetical protein